MVVHHRRPIHINDSVKALFPNTMKIVYIWTISEAIPTPSWPHSRCLMNLLKDNDPRGLFTAFDAQSGGAATSLWLQSFWFGMDASKDQSSPCNFSPAPSDGGWQQLHRPLVITRVWHLVLHIVKVSRGRELAFQHMVSNLLMTYWLEIFYSWNANVNESKNPEKRGKITKDCKNRN